MRRILSYFPDKKLLENNIFRKILFSFIYIIIILFIIITFYFYLRIYRVELASFIDRTEKQGISTVKLFEEVLSQITKDVYLLKNDKEFISILSESSLREGILSFFKSEKFLYFQFPFYKYLIIREKDKVILTYDFELKDIVSLEEKDVIKYKNAKYTENKGLFFAYISDNAKSVFVYRFSVGKREIYITVPINKVIKYAISFTNRAKCKCLNFIYTKNGILIYKDDNINNLDIKNKVDCQKFVKLDKIQENKVTIEKTFVGLFIYIPFKVKPFETPFVCVKFIPIYVSFMLNEYTLILAVFLFFAVLLSLIFSNLIIRQIIYPLQTLKETVVRIAQGDFRKSVNLNTGDEFEELANAINVMARRIEELYLTLEEKVKERTQELEKQKYRLKKLYELSFTFFKDKDEMLTSLLENLVNILDIEMAGVSHKEGEEWRFLSFVDKEGKIIHNSDEVIRDLRLDEIVYENGKPLIIKDTLSEEKWHFAFSKSGIRSYMGVPIFVNNKVFGVLGLINRYPYDFSSQDLELASLFAQRISYLFETEMWEKRIIEKQRELEELNNLLYMKNLELMKLAEDLKRANKAKSNFLANVSHELRTPLNAILGFSEVLLEEYFGELNPKQKEYVKDILESGKHLLSLINDILDLSKIEAGKEELHLGRVDLNKIIDASLILVKEKAMKHNIKLFTCLDKSIKEIVADELKLKQVLFNLLSNALKFTPDGGKVGIVTKSLDNWYRISVWDTGIGIKKEDLGKLFKEFSQLENPYTKKYKGTGLGLALSRKLVEMHGGFIKVVSVYGKGTTFSVFIPKNLEENIKNENSNGG